MPIREFVERELDGLSESHSNGIEQLLQEQQ